MTLIVALALATSSAGAPAYPAAALLDNFAATCSDLSSLAAAEKAAKQAGWEVYEPSKDAPVRKLLDFGMGTAKEMMADDPAFKASERVMRITIAGRQLDLMLTDVTTGATHSLGCRIVDFTATTPIDDASIKTWRSKNFPKNPDAQSASLDNILTVHMWQPGLFSGHQKTQIAFVPQSSPMKETLHLSGINLMSQTRD